MPTCTGPTCGAEVMFVPSAKSGKPMILDAAPGKGVVTRTVDIPCDDEQCGDSTWEGRCTARSEQRAFVVDVYTDHHATCPDVGSFRARAARDRGRPQ